MKRRDEPADAGNTYRGSGPRAAVLGSFALGALQTSGASSGKVKNIILLVGDGMGRANSERRGSTAIASSAGI